MQIDSSLTSRQSTVTAAGERATRQARLHRIFWQTALVLGVFWLVFGPLGSLFYGAVRTGTPGAPDTTFTIANLAAVYVGIVSGGPWQTALLNSLLIAGSVSVVAVALGAHLAWLVARTDIPGRRFIEIALIAPLFYSTLVSLIGWIMLAAPRSGYINQFWRYLTGSEGTLVNVNSFAGIVFVMAIQFIPYVMLMSIGLMRSMDRVLEEAAAVSGASLWTSLRTVTLPILMPGIAAAGLYVFVLALEVFSVPGILGSNIRLNTLAYSLYQYVTGFSADLPLAAAGSTLLLGLTGLALLLYRHFTRVASRYVTVTGSGYQPSAGVRLGIYRYPAMLLCILFVLITSVLPLLAVVVRSLMRVRVMDFDFRAIGLGNFRELFATGYFVEGLKNSILLSVSAATICMILGLILGFWKVRRPGWVITLCDYLVSIPIALPGIILGVGLLWTYVFTPLYLTLWLLLLAMVTRYTGMGMQMVGTGLMQVHRSLEEVAAVSGASTTQTVRTVSLPLLKPVLASLWLLVFLLTARELSASIMLYGIGTATLPILTWQYLSDGLYGTASALAVVQVVAISAIVAAFRLTLGIDVKMTARN